MRLSEFVEFQIELLEPSIVETGFFQHRRMMCSISLSRCWYCPEISTRNKHERFGSRVGKKLFDLVRVKLEKICFGLQEDGPEIRKAFIVTSWASQVQNPSFDSGTGK